MHRPVAIWLFASVIGAIVVALFESAVTAEMAESLYALVGISYIVSSIWGGVLLYKLGVKK